MENREQMISYLTQQYNKLPLDNNSPAILNIASRIETSLERLGYTFQVSEDGVTFIAVPLDSQEQAGETESLIRRTGLDQI